MARWAALVGAKGSGKSTHALELVQKLRARGLSVGGFVQKGTIDALERKGYDLVRLGQAHSRVLARPLTGNEPEGQMSFCSFCFVQDAFDEARSWIEEDKQSAQVLLIDEVSKLEVAGQGHHDAIVQALGYSNRHVIVLSVRAEQLFSVVERFGLEDDAVGVLEVPSSSEQIEEFIDSLEQCLRH